MKPEELINQTKLYQFLTNSNSRNAIKFDSVPKKHQGKVSELIDRIKSWMEEN